MKSTDSVGQTIEIVNTMNVPRVSSVQVAELIAADYAAMGYTHWRCGTCALEHNNFGVADNTPHCDNCGADLHPERGFKTALEAIRAHITSKGVQYNDFALLEVQNSNGLEFIAHHDGIDVWRNNRPTPLDETLALEWSAFFGLEVQS